MKSHLFIAGLLVISAFAAPVQEFDEDCVEEQDMPIEEIEEIQMPQIEPAIAEPDMRIYSEMGGDYQTNEEDCEEEFEDYEEPTAAPMEDEYECEEEEEPLPLTDDLEFDESAFAYDEGNLVISDDAEDIEECDELEAEDVGFADDFGFNIEAGNIEESDYALMHEIEEEAEPVEIEECEE